MVDSVINVTQLSLVPKADNNVPKSLKVLLAWLEKQPDAELPDGDKLQFNLLSGFNTGLNAVLANAFGQAAEDLPAEVSQEKAKALVLYLLDIWEKVVLKLYGGPVETKAYSRTTALKGTINSLAMTCALGEIPGLDKYPSMLPYPKGEKSLAIALFRLNIPDYILAIESMSQGLQYHASIAVNMDPLDRVASLLLRGLDKDLIVPRLQAEKEEQCSASNPPVRDIPEELILELWEQLSPWLTSAYAKYTSERPKAYEAGSSRGCQPKRKHAQSALLLLPAARKSEVRGKALRHGSISRNEEKRFRRSYPWVKTRGLHVQLNASALPVPANQRMYKKVIQS